VEALEIGSHHEDAHEDLPSLWSFMELRRRRED
jgi:hypothetical protein